MDSYRGRLAPLTRWLVLCGVLIASVALFRVTGCNLRETGLPSPFGIVSFVYENVTLIASHSRHTALHACVGVAISCVISTLLILSYFLYRPLGFFLLAPFAIFFAVPVIIFGPIANLVIETSFQLAVLTAVLTVVFPFTLSSINKVQELSYSFEPLMASLGGSWWARLRRLHVPAYSLALVDGLKLMIPWSILGAMLGEYSGGTTNGLGAYLIGLMGNGDPDALWAITIVVTAVSLAIYRVLQHLTHYVQSRLRIHLANPLETWNPSMIGFREILVIVVGSVTAWEAIRALSGLSAFQYPGLLDLSEYLQEKGWSALPSLRNMASSLSAAVVALLATVTLGGGLALAGHLQKRWKRGSEAAILVFQVVPIVALLPLLAIFVGRNWAVGVVMGILATIFPVYTIMSIRLKALPEQYMTMCYAFGASRRSMVAHLLVPWMLTGTATALRVAAPRVLVGVVLAEYLLSGTGLGGSIIIQAGNVDFRGLTLSALITIVAAGAFLFVATLGGRVLQGTYRKVITAWNEARLEHYAR